MKRILIRLAFVFVWMVVKQAFSLPRLFSTDTAPSRGTQDMSRLEVLTDMLTLTKAQQDQVKAIFDDEEGSSRTLVNQLNKSCDALMAAEKAGADNPSIDSLAARVTSIFGRLLAADARAESEVYFLLSDEQRQKLDQLPQLLAVPSAPILPHGPVPAMSSTRQLVTGYGVK